MVLRPAVASFTFGILDAGRQQPALGGPATADRHRHHGAVRPGLGRRVGADAARLGPGGRAHRGTFLATSRPSAGGHPERWSAAAGRCTGRLRGRGGDRGRTAARMAAMAAAQALAAPRRQPGWARPSWLRPRESASASAYTCAASRQSRRRHAKHASPVPSQAASARGISITTVMMARAAAAGAHPGPAYPVHNALMGPGASAPPPGGTTVITLALWRGQAWLPRYAPRPAAALRAGTVSASGTRHVLRNRGVARP